VLAFCCLWLTPHLYKSIQSTVEFLAPYWHLHSIERVLHDIVGVQLIDPPHHRVDIWLVGLRKEQELDTGLRLEALHAEVLGF